MNPFKEYVNGRAEEMARSELLKNDEHTKHTISLRLTQYRLNLVDQLAKELDLSRQALLVNIIDIGVQQVASAYADTFGDEQSQQVYTELLEGAAE